MSPPKELSEEEAKALYDSQFWVELSLRDRAEFQLNTRRLCMPFDVFHEAVESALGRPVWTHEFAQERLRAEFYGEEEAPSLEDIINLIPADKRLLIAAAS